MKTHKILLCSHSPNVVPPAPTPSAERIHSRGTGRRASAQDTQDSPQIYIKLFAMGSWNIECWINIDTSHNRVIVLYLFSSLGGIFQTPLPGESVERVVKSRKHPELTLPVSRYCN